MKYLVTYFDNLDHSDLYNTQIHTCIVDGKLNTLKLFLKHLDMTEWGGFQRFKCSCGLCYEFSLECDDFFDESYCTINYKTLHKKIIENKYICDACQDTFNDKGNEIINFIKRIYYGTIDNYLSISMEMEGICKIGIKQISIENENENADTDGIICSSSMPIVSDTDFYSNTRLEYCDGHFYSNISTEYCDDHFGSRAEDVDL